MSWESFTRRVKNPTYAFSKKAVPVKVVKSTRSKKTKARKLTTRIPKSLGYPVAQRTLCWLNYSDIRQTSSTGLGLTGDYVYNLNSIHDPDRSGTGHQPMGHDQYIQFYNRYRVHKVKYQIIFCALTALPTNVGIFPYNSAGSLNDNVLLELTDKGKMNTIRSDGTSSCRMSGVVDLALLNGSTTAAYNADDRFQAQTGADPTELMGLHITCSNSSVGLTTVEYILKLSYYVEWFDPVALAQS